MCVGGECECGCGVGRWVGRCVGGSVSRSVIWFVGRCLSFSALRVTCPSMIYLVKLDDEAPHDRTDQSKPRPEA